MATEDDVRTASKQFYDALTKMANGDAGPMTAAWSNGADATAMHPIGDRDRGWESVRGSFAGVAGIANGGAMRIDDQAIVVGGDMAFETGHERGHCVIGGHEVDIDHRVTNVYRREGGTWKMVHHHSDPSPAMIDVLAKLQAAKT